MVVHTVMALPFRRHNKADQSLRSAVSRYPSQLVLRTQRIPFGIARMPYGLLGFGVSSYPVGQSRGRKNTDERLINVAVRQSLFCRSVSVV